VKDNDELHFISTNSARVAGFGESQKSGLPYDNTTFNGTSVFYATGVNSANSLKGDVSAGLASTNGVGGITGVFDRNDAGSITSNASFSGGTYSAAPVGSGRYTFSFNGVTYVLYAITTNKGFLLDQSSTSVLSGLMQPQTSPTLNASVINGSFIQTSQQVSTAGAEDQVSALILNASNGTITGTVDETDGTENPNQTVSGTYTVSSNGRGSFDLSMPSVSPQVLYVIGTSTFVVVEMDSSNQNPTVLITER
jgi:hypothetical protein